ncbi:MAG: adenylate/guanylate cyclase domain-containing protein [Cyanobacteriota bacterium]|nr:adenylate/guanylate cyclase domain-containing protein [Cyanobacteriota bacterium]
MKKPVIICIDDEQTVLSSLKRELKIVLGDEFDVETAIGGIDALELLEELLEEGSEIALVISDYIMPDLKGDEVLKRIHEVSPKTLKIMLTGQASLDGVTNAINSAQLYRYIAKPWQSDDLNLTVKEAIKSYMQNQQLAEQNIKLIGINKELEELNQSFSRFVPKRFLKLLDKQSIRDINLGDSVERTMSILFADIRSFTQLSEQMSLQDNFEFINGYLSRMEPAIVENNGFIDKYIGDGIMALFGRSADDAVRAAIAMLNRLNQYNLRRKENHRLPLEVGIGINTGNLMLGTIGGTFRMDSTAIGDPVNLASRLESLTKEYSVPLLISHNTFIALEEHQDYSIRFIDRVKVKGKSTWVAVYEIFDSDEPQLKEGKLATKSTFERGWLLYNQEAFCEAAQLFADCIEQNPRDRVAQIYLQRCQNA